MASAVAAARSLALTIFCNDKMDSCVAKPIPIPVRRSRPISSPRFGVDVKSSMNPSAKAKINAPAAGRTVYTLTKIKQVVKCYENTMVQHDL